MFRSEAKSEYLPYCELEPWPMPAPLTAMIDQIFWKHVKIDIVNKQLIDTRQTKVFLRILDFIKTHQNLHYISNNMKNDNKMKEWV